MTTTSMARRVVTNALKKTPSLFSSHFAPPQPPSSQLRSIFTTSRLDGSWMDKVKGVFTGKKSESDLDGIAASGKTFTLHQFADSLNKARKLGEFKNYVAGRSSEATYSDAFDKQERILRCLADFDPMGAQQKLQVSQKQEAAKKLNCTISEVENALSKYAWAKEAQKMLAKRQEEGKSVPKTFAEIQKLMGKSPLDLAMSSMANSGQTSRNSPCPCGSKKLYKRCCGKDKSPVPQKTK